MTELERLQIKMNALEKQTDPELKEAVVACSRLWHKSGNNKAVVAFMDMVKLFWGIKQTAAFIEMYGFTELKEFL